jgi:hypothetical protein|nr:hypothetical protein [uncultured Treponema sp.]
MKKSLFAAVFAALCFSVWAQVPQTIKPDYHRSAMHYLDGDKHFVNSDVFFMLNSSDKETGLDFVEFSVDESAFMTYHNPFQLLQEGHHEVSYRGFDNSRNLEVAKTFAVIVDNMAPKTTLNTTEPLFYKGLTAYCSANTKWYIAAADDLAGSGTAGAYIGTDLNELSLRGTGKEAEEAYYSLTEEGPTKVYFTAIDNVGNLAPVALTSVVVDTTAPTVFIENSDRLINKDSAYTVFPSANVVDEEGRIIVSTKETIAFGATDELSGVDAIYVKINDADYVKYIEPIQFDAETVYNIDVKAIDNVGNVSEPVSYKFYVDKITPASDVQMIDKDGNAPTTWAVSADGQ